jgi:putative ABC transport system substrate-binding protein
MMRRRMPGATRGKLLGLDIRVGYRWAEGEYDRLPALAAELVHQRVTVIAANPAIPAFAAKAATWAMELQ